MSLILPSRTLWTPPSIDDLIVWTAGKLQRGSSGKAKRGPLGKFRKNSATNTKCCCNACKCWGETTLPTNIRVVFAGTTSAAGCINHRAFRSFKVTGNLDGSYCLTNMPGTCYYTFTTTNLTTQEYSDTTCTTPEGGAESSFIVIDLLGGALFVECTKGGDGFDPFYAPFSLLQSTGNPVLSNATPSIGTSFFDSNANAYSCATGGTATITAPC